MQKGSEQLVEALVRWYQFNGRKNLPWRKTRNPYKILVAELMLQKTHAERQVLPIFCAFIQKYPSVASLSEARLDEVRNVITPLGLQNTRSRRLIAIAVALLREYGGNVPKEYDELISLPGVGEYVANAVLCMAFGKRTAMVDANFGRVLGRVFFGKEDYPPSEGKTKKVALEILPQKNWREYNLAIMDIGAAVCTPASPKCDCCPLNQYCLYFSQNPKDAKANHSR